MKSSFKKIVVLSVTLLALMSQAVYGHPWYPAGRYVKFTNGGCRRVVVQNFCRMHHGNRECRSTRSVDWRC